MTKKECFIINGSGGVGKDTFVSFVNKATQSLYSCQTINFSSVDKIKKIARIIGWNGGKTEKDRKFLSDLKILTTNYNDMPFNSMQNKVDEFYHSYGDTNDYNVFLFLHIREPKEIKRAAESFNAKTVLVKRDSVKHITSNIADKGVFDYKYDVIINNNGNLTELEEKAIAFTTDYFNSHLKQEY